MLLSIYRYRQLYIYKLADSSRGLPKGPLFKSYYTKVLERALLLSLYCSTSLDPYLIMLSVKQGGIKYHFLESLVWLDTVSVYLTHTHALSLSIYLIHTDILSFSISLLHTHSLYIYISFKHAHIISLSLSLSHTFSIPLSLSMSFSLTLSPYHTHTHTHSLTLSLSLSLSLYLSLTHAHTHKQTEPNFTHLLTSTNHTQRLS